MSNLGVETLFTFDERESFCFSTLKPGMPETFLFQDESGYWLHKRPHIQHFTV